MCADVVSQNFLLVEEMKMFQWWSISWACPLLRVMFRPHEPLSSKHDMGHTTHVPYWIVSTKCICRSCLVWRILDRLVASCDRNFHWVATSVSRPSPLSPTAAVPSNATAQSVPIITRFVSGLQLFFYVGNCVKKALKPISYTSLFSAS